MEAGANAILKREQFMETHANYARIGAFVLFGSLGSILFVLWLSQSNFGHSQIFYDIFFKGSVAGLKVGSAVQYRGVPIGTVKEVLIPPQNVEEIQVIIAIKDKAIIKADMIASLESQGLTGISYVQIQGGLKDSPQLEIEGNQLRPIIPSKVSLVEEISKSAPELLKQANYLVKEMQSMFGDDNRETISKTIKNIERITEFLTPSKEAKDTVLKDMSKTMDTVWDTLAEFRTMSKELKDILKENRQGIRGFSSTGLESFNKFLTEGQETMMSLRRVTDSLERSPSRFFYNDPNQGVPTK